MYGFSQINDMWTKNHEMTIIVLWRYALRTNDKCYSSMKKHAIKMFAVCWEKCCTRYMSRASNQPIYLGLWLSLQSAMAWRFKAHYKQCCLTTKHSCNLNGKETKFIFKRKNTKLAILAFRIDTIEKIQTSNNKHQAFIVIK